MSIPAKGFENRATARFKMIRIVDEGAYACPEILCYACKRRILDYRLANAIWGERGRNLHYVHKACDAATHPRLPYSCELGEHLLYLLQNSGLTPEGLSEIKAQVKEFQGMA